MPATTIPLGFGRLPQGQPPGGTLDVHLHLDHPATPISLGESWGPQSIGNGFTLREATDSKWEPHLRACGCEWLLLVATEERLRGRIFTPEEILARRPASSSPPMPEPAARAVRTSSSDVLPRIRAAIQSQDFEALEGLRDGLNAEIVRQITAEWHSGLPWSVKDAYAALLMDQTADCVRPIFEDALRSPTVESRAYAVCVLTRDFSRFDAMLADGGLDAVKVDAQVRALSSLKP